MKENDQSQQKAVRSRHCLAAMEAGKHRIAMSDAAGKPGQRNDRRRDVERQHHREKRLERIQQDAERRVITNGCINVDDETYNKLQQYSRLIIE